MVVLGKEVQHISVLLSKCQFPGRLYHSSTRLNIVAKGSYLTSNIRSCLHQVKPSHAKQWLISRQFCTGLQICSAKTRDGGSSGQKVSFTNNSCINEEPETHGQALHSFGSSHKLQEAASRFDIQDTERSPSSADKYQVDIASEHHADVYNHKSSVNLSACMQSQVPQPYGKTPTHMNMPGGVNRREHKYIQGRLSDMSGKREFSTTAYILTDQRLDEHGNPTYSTGVDRILKDPCPQGIQGEDCEQFKLWLSNCIEQGKQEECERLANEYIAGRKTLAQLFAEFDLEINKVASDKQETVSSAAAGDSGAGSDKAGEKTSRAAQLGAAVRDYGSTVVVFHVAISLASLGLFYTLVASNVDMASVLTYFNISLGSVQSTVGTASTFAVAYAVHKVFAPVRIGITLTCAPFIVRSLRARGILKTPKAAVAAAGKN